MGTGLYMTSGPNGSGLLLLHLCVCCTVVCLQVVGLYKKLGFVDDPQGIKGMAFQRKKKERKGLF